MKSHIKLRTRIYVSMLLIIILSSVIIGVFTISHFNSQNEAYHTERLERKERAVLLAVNYFLNAYSISSIPEDMVVVLGDKFNEIADINKLNINVYNMGGELIFSAKSDSVALLKPQDQLSVFTLKMLEEKREWVNEIEANGRTFFSSFSIIRDNKNKPLVIVNIPYLEKTDSLKEELIDFFISLAEIYAFLLLGASILAYFLSNYITGSLKKVGQKMRSVQVGKRNEPLLWTSNDEIGQLVMEYNRMLKELEKSAELLAKSERESAWREMAKQVAHEIKNPLTPMRLKVQHLQRVIAEENNQSKEKIADFCQAMIEQIDTLSTIASEFSNFYQLPKSKEERIDLKELLESVVNLFKDNTTITFEGKINVMDSFEIKADRSQITRVFNNLIKNAIQSIPDNKQGLIAYSIDRTDNKVVINIQDNGSGIPYHLKDKIFSPNFTTKNSGMGLGLAMVKSIVESMNGKIWFETEVNQGTIFYIELPENYS